MTTVASFFEAGSGILCGTCRAPVQFMPWQPDEAWVLCCCNNSRCSQFRALYKYTVPVIELEAVPRQ